MSKKMKQALIAVTSGRWPFFGKGKGRQEHGFGRTLRALMARGLMAFENGERVGWVVTPEGEALARSWESVE